MAIVLPASPAPARAKPRLVQFGLDLKPPTGAEAQRALRLGTRYAVELAYPPMTKAQFDDLFGALLDAATQETTVVAEYPQGAGGGVGAPLVNGGGQTGSTLNADGLTAGVAIPRGRFFSFQAGGRHYLHATRQAVTASGGGAAALPIGPMLRASPADNAALEFVAPKIEGFVGIDEIAWDHDEAGIYRIAFTITENA
ncbi:hypothetical protein [Phenylobacterium sp.]|uniref:hypothetical protein n=1 Tax=Phenylobacterium sp. TaxID=1871053 RepID=UPI0039598AFC